PAHLAVVVDDFLDEVAGRGRLLRCLVGIRLLVPILALPCIRCGHGVPTSISSKRLSHEFPTSYRGMGAFRNAMASEGHRLHCGSTADDPSIFTFFSLDVAGDRALT